MSLETRVDALATAIATDVKTLLAQDGDLTALTTTAKTSLVAAINELAGIANAAAGINDGATASGSTWSSSKISTELANASAALVDSSPDLLNTLNELAAALEDNPDVIASLRTLITNNATAISTLATNVGDTDKDFVATYTAAKAA